MSLAIEPMSSLSQFAPSDHAGSYSTLSILSPFQGPSVTSTSFLQATGHAWQVGSFTRMVSCTCSPLIASARSPNEVVWLLRVPSAPIRFVTFMSTLVP